MGFRLHLPSSATIPAPCMEQVQDLGGNKKGCPEESKDYDHSVKFSTKFDQAWQKSHPCSPLRGRERP